MPKFEKPVKSVFSSSTEQPPEWGALDALREHGLIVDHLVPDGEIQRCGVEGKSASSKAGWYIWHADQTIPHLIYGRWDDDTTHHWSAREPANGLEREHVEAERREAKRKVDELREERYRAGAKRAKELLDAAEPMPTGSSNHPYLRSKEVGAFGLYRNGSTLIIPVRNLDGTLTSVQTISAEKQKSNLYGGRMREGLHILGTISDQSRVWIAEGYSTAASVYTAMEEPVICAFSAHNLAPVARALRKKHPGVSIWIAGDNDENGVGQKAAQTAATAVGGLYRVPKHHKDWNDVDRVGGGPQQVREGLLQPSEDLNLYAIGFSELPTLELPPQQHVLGPLCTEWSMMIFSKTGIGKTHLALGMVDAISRGVAFGPWEARPPAKVLYIDGEMPIRAMKDRWRTLYASRKPAIEPVLISLSYLQTDVNIALPEHQRVLSALFDEHKADVVNLDNLMSLSAVANTSMNSDEYFAPIKPWIKQEAAKGRLLVLFDHTNKGGTMFGSTTKTWGLSVSLRLDEIEKSKRVPGTLGVKVIFDKARELPPEEQRAFYMRLDLNTGTWTHEMVREEAAPKKPDDLTREEKVYSAREMWQREGFSLGEIGKALGVPKATIQGWVKGYSKNAEIDETDEK